ncbi:hypothetical protein [Actinophytocola sp.]|uniref:hypothetical protein n=1 Tax=Actinophytocola sp. TaxID=1872138 RepID=UPI00389A5D65
MAVVVLAAALTGTAIATTAANSAPHQALALPSPLRYVSSLDLECFRTSPYTPPPLHEPITLSHLNPVLAEQARWTIDSLGPRTQLCSPVAKNGVIPPTGVLDFVQYTDLSCYRISGPNMNLPVKLSHLNPVLKDFPPRAVTLLTPEQLCVPVIKNQEVPPAEVLRFVQYIDLACFRETPQVPLGTSLKLTQLNKALSPIPTTEVGVGVNRQLCVPVRKNDQEIPDDVLKIVQWIDLEKFDISAPTPPPIELKLRHINPLLTDLPNEPAVLLARQQLGVPMAKNGKIPTG